jgi:hypothetical protein
MVMMHMSVEDRIWLKVVIEEQVVAPASSPYVVSHGCVF